MSCFAFKVIQAVIDGMPKPGRAAQRLQLHRQNFLAIRRRQPAQVHPAMTWLLL
jgi:hypothetical protein